MNDNKNIFGESMDDNVRNMFGDNAEPITTMERQPEVPQTPQPMEMPTPQEVPNPSPVSENFEPIEINNANLI